MGKSVLFVDDEPNILQALKRELRSWAASKGIELLFAESGESALAVMGHDPDIALVVTDYRMPGMNGTVLIKTIKERYPRTATVMLTGFSDDDEVSQAIDSRKKGYIKKPWDSDSLVREIESALENGGIS